MAKSKSNISKTPKATKEKNAAGSLSHFDSDGAARMVDVSKKDATLRTAVATAAVRMLPATMQIVREGGGSKGDVLQVARLAGIMAAKRTSQLIPLCHSIPLTSAEIDFAFSGNDTLHISATIKADHKTGVEMEALTAVSIAALTVYDMCKAVDRGIVISSIELREKTGGSSGTYRRNTDSQT